MKVLFQRECCYCGDILGVDWLDYDTLSPHLVRQYENHGKIVSHGACETCFKREMAEAEKEAEDTAEFSIEELETYLRENP